MHKLLSMPCQIVQRESTVVDDPDVCIAWRKAMETAEAYKPKIIGKDIFGKVPFHYLRVYAAFNWKLRTQYHYAEYEYWPNMAKPPKFRCLYLFKAPFFWSEYIPMTPDPIRAFPLFQEVNLNRDGTPMAAIPMITTYGWARPDHWSFTDDELRNIGEWEKITSYYNYQQYICVGKYDYLNKFGTITKTGEKGKIVDVRPPDRDYELWDTTRPGGGLVATIKHWLKIRALRYVLELPDGSKRITTLKLISISLW